MDLSTPKNIHFVGVAGTGMSAIAQYLAGSGHCITGSDRGFGTPTLAQTQKQLEACGIICLPQDGAAVTQQIDAVIVSTAIEKTIPDLAKAVELGVLVLHRADMLKIITNTKKTIAFSGTSGKSTTAAMAFHILKECGCEPSLITGAGLVSLQQQGLIGNAYVGKGNWLVIEADESDGTLVKYHPEIGVLLNLDKDHKEMSELYEIFETFKQNTKHLIVNNSHAESAQYSTNLQNDFGGQTGVGFQYGNFKQLPSSIQFTVNNIAFEMPILGEHNMENVVAALAACCQTGLVQLADCVLAVSTYKGIYRRLQMIGTKHGVLIVDDYAHNPVKIAAAIKTFQPLTTKIIAWFQPHGYGPTKFLRNDFVHEIAKTLRPTDEIWMSEIYYAGGTAVKDISALDLINDLKAQNTNAFFVANRADLAAQMKTHAQEGCVILLMGARDPSLEYFATAFFEAF
jgi:UDP-N-acetylmuramate--alanine ligase